MKSILLLFFIRRSFSCILQRLRVPIIGNLVTDNGFRRRRTYRRTITDRSGNRIQDIGPQHLRTHVADAIAKFVFKITDYTRLYLEKN